MRKLKRSNSSHEDKDISTTPTQFDSAQISKLINNLKNDSNITIIKKKFDAKLSKSPAHWFEKLKDLGLSSIIIENDKLLIKHILSEDIKSNPYKYVKLILTKNNVSLQYTLDKKDNPKRMHLIAAQLMFLVLSASEALALPPSIGSYFYNSIKDAQEFVLLDTDFLASENYSLKSKNKEYEKRLASLMSEQESSTKKLLQASAKIEALTQKLNKLLKVPDSVIDSQVFEWLISHDGYINLHEMSKSQNILPSRIEASLSRMCKSGRIMRLKK